jgi:cytidylate kinase
VKQPLTIAIDGPAASGKSTVGRELANRLRYLYFDTGVMYRAVTLAALRRRIPVTDETAITRLARDIAIEVEPPTVADGRQYTVTVDGDDVTWDLRRPEVDANVSLVSSYRGVREALSAQQRRIGERGRVVMVGRDIGTVVLPDAELKIFLTATPGERARRRLKDLQARGETASFDNVLRDIRRRDRIDSDRTYAPLRPADDAIILDTTNRTVEQVIEAIVRQFGKN